jgi:hypothetical protein
MTSYHTPQQIIFHCRFCHKIKSRKQIKIKQYRERTLKMFNEYIIAHSSKAVVLVFTVLSNLVHFLEDQIQRT